MNCRFVSRLLCAVSLTIGVASPTLVLAQDDATVEMARQRFREGVQFYDQHQFEKARLAFLQAYALKPHPTVLLNLAQSELRSGHPDDAANHFAECLRSNTGGSNAHETDLGFSAAKAKVGAVTVNVDANGAEISLDGSTKGMAPLPGPLFVLPGSHTVEARAGERHASRTFTAVAGQSVTATLSLRGSNAALPPTPPPPASSETTDSAPKPEPEPPAEASAPPETAWESAPEEAPPSPEAASSGREPFFRWLGHTPLAIAGSVVGVGGLGAGLTLALVSNHDYANAKATRNQILDQWELGGGTSDATVAVDANPNASPCDISPAARKAIGNTKSDEYAVACQQFADDSGKGDTLKTWAIVSTVVGGIAIVGTVVYYFLDAKPKEQAAAQSFQARLVPVVAPGNASLSIVGRF